METSQMGLLNFETLRSTGKTYDFEQEMNLWWYETSLCRICQTTVGGSVGSGDFSWLDNTILITFAA